MKQRMIDLILRKKKKSSDSINEGKVKQHAQMQNIIEIIPFLDILRKQIISNQIRIGILKNQNVMDSITWWFMNFLLQKTMQEMKHYLIMSILRILVNILNLGRMQFAVIEFAKIPLLKIRMIIAIRLISAVLGIAILGEVGGRINNFINTYILGLIRIKLITICIFLEYWCFWKNPHRCDLQNSMRIHVFPHKNKKHAYSPWIAHVI